MGNDERVHKNFFPKVGVAYVMWPYNYRHTIEHIFKTIWLQIILISGFDCRVLHTMVYCGTVRSAILATAWLVSQCWQVAAWGKLSSVAGHHSFFPTVGSWEFRLSALMDSDLACVNGKSGRHRWCYADAFKRSIGLIWGAIYHFTIFTRRTRMLYIVYLYMHCMIFISRSY